MVVAVVASFAGMVKARVSKTQVDNTAFRLHYRWTTTLCYLCCALVAASDFIGAPIECENAEKAVTTYCWVASTYTINTTAKDNDFTYYGAYDSSFHGIGTFDPKVHEKTFHAYYQWVPFILFIQGCLFYLPHQLWKVLEGKQLDNLLQGLTSFSILDGEFDQKKKNIIKYLRSSWGLNGKYCSGYVFCEVLNFVNILAQMFLLDAFFGGMFWHYGAKILLLPTEDDKGRYDPMIETFPRVTKCEFHKFGPSGSIQRHDYLCILPQNLLNEKIFLVLWVWFVILGVATLVQIVFRGFMLQFATIRLKMLEQRGKMGPSYELDALIRQMPLGDYFLLYSIGKNVNAFCFRDILKEMTDLPTNMAVRFPSAPPLSPRKELYPRASMMSELRAEEEDDIELKLRRKIDDEAKQ